MASIIRSPQFGREARRLTAPDAVDVQMQAEVETRLPPLDDETVAVRLNADLEASEQRNAELAARIDALESELANLRRKAEQQDYAQGYQLGLEAGAAEAQAEFETERNSITSLLEDLREQGRQYLQQLEQTNVEIIFVALAKIIARKVEDPEYLRDLVREQIKNVGSPGTIVVRVAPQDYQTLFATEDADPKTATDNLRFVPDDHIQLGGCIIEGERGGLDARLEIQMQQFKEMLLDVYARRQAGDL